MSHSQRSKTADLDNLTGDVARDVEKRHDNVLRDIRELECSDGFSLHNFVESEWINERGKTLPVIEMNRDGLHTQCKACKKARGTGNTLTVIPSPSPTPTIELVNPELPMVIEPSMSSVFERDGLIWTTSLEMARGLEKGHFHILEKIKELDCSHGFNASNFRLVDYPDAKGERRPIYELTRDGFTFLMSRFTGAAPVHPLCPAATAHEN